MTSLQNDLPNRGHELDSHKSAMRLLHVSRDGEAQSRIDQAANATLTSHTFDLVLDHVASLDAARSTLAENPYDLVICDLALEEGGGLALVDALVEAKGTAALTAYAHDLEVESAGAVLQHGAQDVFDASIFDPRVLDQVLARQISKRLNDGGILELVHAHDAIFAHRRHRDRQMHHLVSQMFAITLEPLSLEQAVDKVLGLLIEVEWLSDIGKAACFLLASDEERCLITAQRGIEEGLLDGLSKLASRDRSSCLCMRIGNSPTPHYNLPTEPMPACQALCGEHASHVVTLLDHQDQALGTLAVWCSVNMPQDEDAGQLMETAGRVVSTIVTHRQQVDRIQLLNQVVEQSPLSVMVTDLAENTTYANSALYRLTGYGPEEILGHNPRILGSGLVSKETFQEMWSLLSEGKTWEGELINRKKDGELYWEDAIISPVKGSDGKVSGYAAVKRDITELLRFKAQLEHQATHDPLTDLANRSLVGDRVSQAVNRARRHGDLVVALYIDIDQFSDLNQTHGHLEGDQLLRDIAERLSTLARDYDTVARLGNDEFVVIISGLPEEQKILNFCDRYLEVFNRPFSIADHEITVSASMGAASYPTDSQDGEELLRHASMALTRCKESGGNGYSLFGQQMEEELRERYELLSALRGALGKDQLELHFQPQVDPDSGEILGAEALLRWNLPEKGQIPPFKFIPLAESSGQIIPIGGWVLETACLQLAEWGAETGKVFPVSVNVAGSQFHEEGFVASVEKALEKSGIEPKMLVLELTESMLLKNPEEVQGVMHKLNGLGVQLAIDDFGTGYSSLSYLANLPIGQLKVDRAFIRDLESAPNNEIIVSTIISMAHSLGMEVVAEGAETQDQLDFLVTYHCDLIQGYFYSRPVPLAEFKSLVIAPSWTQTQTQTD